MSTQIGKITPSSIGCKPALAQLEQKEVPCAVVTGRATGTMPKIDPKNGEVFIALTGNFEAVNLHTGEEFISCFLFLPGGMHDSAVAFLVEQEKLGNNITMEFDLALIAIPSSNPRGYSWKGSDIGDTIRVDPLLDIKRRRNEKFLAMLPVETRSKLLSLPAPSDPESVTLDHDDIADLSTIIDVKEMESVSTKRK